MFEYDKLADKRLLLCEREAFLESKGKSNALRVLSSAIVKLVMACALLIEADADIKRSDLASQLFTEAWKATALVSASGHWSIELLYAYTLVATFRFHVDDEISAYTFVGFAVRIAFALGLNNKSYNQPRTLSPSSPCPSTNLNIWWCLFVLDRRWSFGVGLPYAVAEAQIQTPELPINWQSHDSPLSYLYAMVGYCRIAGLVWAHISADANTLTQSLSKSHRLQESVTFWRDNLPAVLKLQNTTDLQYDPPWRAKCKVLLHLRANQMRLLILRPLLLSSRAMDTFAAESEEALEIGIDTIRTLVCVQEQTEMLKYCRLHYNHFLVSSLALIFMLVAKAPQKYANRCASTFFAALQLIKILSVDSRITRTLLSRIHTLKDGWALIQHKKRRHQPVPSATTPGLSNSQYPEPSIASEDESISYDKVSQELQSLFNTFSQGRPENSTNGKPAESSISGSSLEERFVTPEGYDAGFIMEQPLSDVPLYALDEWNWGEWLDSHNI